MFTVGSPCCLIVITDFMRQARGVVYVGSLQTLCRYFGHGPVFVLVLLREEGRCVVCVLDRKGRAVEMSPGLLGAELNIGVNLTVVRINVGNRSSCIPYRRQLLLCEYNISGVLF